MKYRLNKGVSKNRDNIEALIAAIIIVVAIIKINSLVEWAIKISG